MKENDINPVILASYALMKALSNDKKYISHYELLAEFISYIIASKRIRQFTLQEMRDLLLKEFGFDNIPQAAVKTSLKKVKQCRKSGISYFVTNIDKTAIDRFEKTKDKEIVQSRRLMEKLFEFADSFHIDGISHEQLEACFIKYLINDSEILEKRYADIISKFIISSKDDLEIKKQIDEVRTGSILCCGLAYNINEIGGLKNDLVLFLDTEVIFNIVGYNGSLYQDVAADLMTQVKAANQKKKRVKLRYFEDVKREIENFFTSAELIIDGKIPYAPSTVMSNILKGCKNAGDVIDRQADFFLMLERSFGITLDEKKTYYNEEDYKYNIETLNNDADDIKTQEAIKYISHINKLRKGKLADNYEESEFLLITETKKIQELSNNIARENKKCGFALPISEITNYLWFKLGIGFSRQDYPRNIDVSYKAKAIVSGELARQATVLFDETLQKHRNGEIDSEQVAKRMVLLNDKMRMAEEIDKENLESLLDFSPQYIEKYEEGIRRNQSKLQEIAKEKQMLEKQNIDLEEGKASLEKQNAALRKKDYEQQDKYAKRIQEQERIILKLQRENKIESLRKNLSSSRKKIIVKISIKAVVFIGIVFVSFYISRATKSDFASIAGLLVSVVGLVTGGSDIKRHVTEQRERKNKINELQNLLM